jgi:regulator of replication initiation timing
MKKLRYVGEHQVVIAATGQVVEPNHQVEIEDDDLAKSLLEQEIWERVTTKKETQHG